MHSTTWLDYAYAVLNLSKIKPFYHGADLHTNKTNGYQTISVNLFNIALYSLTQTDKI